MICKVIAYNMIAIHKKRIIHADIKPNNVLIKKTITGTYTAKIIDFDSSYFEDSLPTSDDLQCDTIYLSPEGFCTYVRKQKRLPQSRYICFGNLILSISYRRYAFF